MMDRQLESLLHMAADAANDVILPYFRADYALADKGSDGWFDPVTDADRAAEQAIRAIVTEHFPDDGFVGEEFGTTEGKNGRRWIVDPIDGTRSFLCGVPLFGMIMGLAEGDTLLTGMFNQPFTGERFYGDGNEAFYWKDGNKKPIRTRQTTSLDDALMMTTSPNIFTAEEKPFYAAVEEKVRLARYGSDGYAYALLAAGQIDLVIESGLQTYDVAGLIPIVEGAGGIFTTWTGGNAINGGRVIAAANADIHAAALEIINSCP